jgi:molybdate transport system ATP-binding protein
MSTAPLPKQGGGIGMSYEEWAAKNSAPDHRRPRQPSRQPPQTNLSRPAAAKPQKYNSMVFLPDTVGLKWPKKDHEDKDEDATKKKNDDFELNCLDFAIAKPGKGGHVVLGRNGSGKSLLVKHLSNPELFDDYSDDGWKLLNADAIAYVSFESHLQVLQEEPHLTVHDSITGGAGNLSKAAQYLVVRFGLKPLLHRTMSTLSTGEIRKCLLVAALSKEPRLLVLENAFDGLDQDSRRELQAIVSKTIQGLGQSGKLLVQHVNAEYVPPAQVLMSTHRPEEIVDEISTVSLVVPKKNDGHHTPTTTTTTTTTNLVTIRRPPDFSQEQLMFMALGLDKDHNKCQNWSILAPWQDNDPTLPSLDEIQNVWSTTTTTTTTTNDTPDTLISLDSVEIRRRRDGDSTNDEDDDDDAFATLLRPLSWNIEKGQRWLIAGGNGAGKSTLSRFLLSTTTNDDDDDDGDHHEGDCTRDLTSGVYLKDENTKIGWVSTESHLGNIVGGGGNVGDKPASTTTTTTAWDTIRHNGSVSDSVAETMVQWVFGSQKDTISVLQDHSLQELSQGQQKLVLIASALAVRPNLLILDEPTQGLDWVHRRRVLALLERICQASSDTSLVFITHYQEEWIPSISRVLHLENGHALYQGPKKAYKPDEMKRRQNIQ